MRTSRLHGRFGAMGSFWEPEPKPSGSGTWKATAASHVQVVFGMGTQVTYVYARLK